MNTFTSEHWVRLDEVNLLCSSPDSATILDSWLEQYKELTSVLAIAE